MKKHLFVLLMLLPVISLANPSITSNSSNKNDTSSSSSTKRDDSFSADQSDGKRATESESNERAKERSKTHSESVKKGSSQENSRSNSSKNNITSLMLKTFRERYETDKNPNKTLVQQMLGECKAVSGLATEYPTLDECPTISNPGHGAELDLEHVVPYRIATHFSDGNCGANNFDNTLWVNKSFDANPNNQTISRYARCRMFASKWIDIAGSMMPAYAEVSSEVEVSEKINLAFEQMDNDEHLFEDIKAQVRKSWANARCTNWLTQWHNIQEPNMNCGVFVVKGHDVWVENRKTLSEDSIEGKSYEITLNASKSDSLSSDESLSKDYRLSKSHRDSDNHETFAEHKKASSINTTTSTDENESNSISTGSTSDISATPK